MKFSVAINGFVTFLLILFMASVSSADQVKETAAINSAKIFLQLVDSGHYGESWEVTSAFFKQQVSKEQWVKQLKSFRPTFGNIINRKIKGMNYAKSLPGAPDGEYVVIQFSTSFTKKKSSIETVTPMRESDGKWRVTGYYIR